MTEYEVYELAISLRELRHAYGEATILQIQFWVGVSFAFIAITFIAPGRLTIGVAVFLIALYAAFTTSTFVNV